MGVGVGVSVWAWVWVCRCGCGDGACGAYHVPSPVPECIRATGTREHWLDLLDFFSTAGTRLTEFFEQSLDLFAKLCGGGNMHTRDVVAEFVPREVLVAVLGLGTVYGAIPDRVKSRFWSIASVVYLHRPLHTSTLLGIHTAIKDCSQLETSHVDGTESWTRTGIRAGCSPRHSASVSAKASAGTPSCEGEDHPFLSRMKAAATEYLRHNTRQSLQQPDRNILTKQVSRGKGEGSQRRREVSQRPRQAVEAVPDGQPEPFGAGVEHRSAEGEWGWEVVQLRRDLGTATGLPPSDRGMPWKTVAVGYCAARGNPQCAKVIVATGGRCWSAGSGLVAVGDG